MLHSTGQNICNSGPANGCVHKVGLVLIQISGRSGRPLHRLVVVVLLMVVARHAPHMAGHCTLTMPPTAGLLHAVTPTMPHALMSGAPLHVGTVVFSMVVVVVDVVQVPQSAGQIEGKSRKKVPGATVQNGSRLSVQKAGSATPPLQ